jgi:hypothetical protein
MVVRAREISHLCLKRVAAPLLPASCQCLPVLAGDPPVPAYGSSGGFLEYSALTTPLNLFRVYGYTLCFFQYSYVRFQAKNTSSAIEGIFLQKAAHIYLMWPIAIRHDRTIGATLTWCVRVSLPALFGRAP